MSTAMWLIVVVLILLLLLVLWFALSRSYQVLQPRGTITVEYRGEADDPLLDDTRGELDMAYGDPIFFVPFWKKEQQQLSLDESPFPAGTIGYELDPKFGQTVRDFLGYVFGYFPDPETLVYGNGSMQLLTAYLACLKKSVSDPENRSLIVMVNRPSMPILPDLVSDLSGITIVGHDYDGPVDLEYLIVPNFGNVEDLPPRKARYRLLDHAYAWPAYISGSVNDKTELGSNLGIRTSVVPERGQKDIPGSTDHLFSMSKGLGFAGFRCGFGVIEDPNLRSLIQSYITTTTLGINTLGWRQVLSVIGRPNRSLVDRALTYGKAVIHERWRRLRSIGDPTLSNDQGAYAWFKRSPDLFSDHRIRVTRGSSLLVDDTWSRVSMMGSRQNFDLFLSRLRRINHGGLEISRSKRNHQGEKVGFVKDFEE